MAKTSDYPEIDWTASFLADEIGEVDPAKVEQFCDGAADITVAQRTQVADRIARDTAAGRLPFGPQANLATQAEIVRRLRSMA